MKTSEKIILAKKDFIEYGFFWMIKTYKFFGK